MLTSTEAGDPSGLHRAPCDDTEDKGRCLQSPPHVAWSPQADLGFMSPLGAFCPCPSPPVSQCSRFPCPLHPNLGIAGKSSQRILCPLCKPLINYCTEQQWV